MLRCQLMAAVLIVLPTIFLSSVVAQTAQQRQIARVSVVPIAPAREVYGIDTSRLSAKDLQRWKMIERLVFAEDGKSQPLHPTLRGMWEWIETSGHTVYVEIVRPGRGSTSTAGNFSIEKFDPRGEHHIGVIKLNLTNIDLAYVGPSAARETGFIPFEKLGKVERYAEVLGHEFAHAVDILTNHDRVKSVEFMIELTNEELLRSHPRRKGDIISPDLKKRLSRRDTILVDLEKRAEFMEQKVWKELIQSKGLREKSQSLPSGR
jgi:hypothetical protein